MEDWHAHKISGNFFSLGGPTDDAGNPDYRLPFSTLDKQAAAATFPWTRCQQHFAPGNLLQKLIPRQLHWCSDILFATIFSRSSSYSFHWGYLLAGNAHGTPSKQALVST